MNKLNVALKLLKLLNERKEIDSALVSGELDVSIRTAQRYLSDLSSMPCVSYDEQNHRYSIIEDYPLKRILLGCSTGSVVSPLVTEAAADGALQLRDIVCKTCGGDCEVVRKPK